ncbi:hypothetical protein [Paenibacillus sp. FJAT-26967]|uniref:hypothetical protein n=1 Tax=Paenibacillus sp. FJAT-26967 TaxID=1729690 RepID=UPI000838A2AA|nr:hypothetical protein [Paenibacillus sp. FJAT-26967]
MAVILSTGTINRTRSTRAAHLEILNLNFSSRTVRVQVIDWDRRVSLFNQLVTISANQNRFVTVSLAGVSFHYEIRVTVPSTRNLIVNTFAIDNDTFTVENNNVLQEQLVRVFSPLPGVSRTIKAKSIQGVKKLPKPKK